MPLISVIIPIYNAGKYLRPCLTSVVKQTYQNLEIILVDDGSKDDSLKICKEFANKDARIKVIAKENGGVSSARNAGLAICSGEWVSFIDSDDYLETDAYEHCVNILREHTCDTVCYEFFATYPNRDTPHKMDENRYGMLDRKQSMHLLHGGLPFTWCRLFSRAIIADTLFDTTIARGEDGKFNTEVLHRAQKVYFSKKPLYHYVQSEESACRGKFRRSQFTALRLIDFYPEFFSAHYPELLDQWYKNMCNLIISIYYDMYADDGDYTAEMKEAKRRFYEVYKQVNKKSILMKSRIKFSFFKAMPWAFCMFHKISLLVR